MDFREGAGAVTKNEVEAAFQQDELRDMIDEAIRDAGYSLVSPEASAFEEGALWALKTHFQKVAKEGTCGF